MYNNFSSGISVGEITKFSKSLSINCLSKQFLHVYIIPN